MPRNGGTYPTSGGGGGLGDSYNNGQVPDDEAGPQISANLDGFARYMGVECEGVLWGVCCGVCLWGVFVVNPCMCMGVGIFCCCHQQTRATTHTHSQQHTFNPPPPPPPLLENPVSAPATPIQYRLFKLIRPICVFTSVMW